MGTPANGPGVAAPAHVERLAGADRDHAHFDAAVSSERRQQVAEQARLFGGGGRGDDDGFILRLGLGVKRKQERDSHKAAMGHDGRALRGPQFGQHRGANAI